MSTIAADQLKVFLERIEKLEAEKAELSEDVKGVYAEAKAAGFDTKVMKKIIALRAMDSAERQELDDLIDTYRTAVGI